MPDFVKGLDLCEGFFHEVVKPIVDREFPDLRYDAALIGSGSEILGYDDLTSTDHHWGLRAMLFARDDDHPRYADPIREVMSRALPYTYRGYTTHFEVNPLEADKGVLLPKNIESGPVNHRVIVLPLRAWSVDYLGSDPLTDWTPQNWLTISEQRLLTMTAVRVYHSGLGLLDQIRAKLAYYPRDMWLYCLAAQWMRISQEEPFVGRTASVGDEIGSQVLAAGLVRHLMRLSFLQEQCYAPYSKWFGTAFSQLPIAAALSPHLAGALAAQTYPEREVHLVNAYRVVAEKHNALGLTAPLETEASHFWGRPFRVIHAERFAEAIMPLIQDEAVRALPPFIGGIDQWVDSTDVLSWAARAQRLKDLYQGQ